ncbi:hypothetical protein EMPS_04988 [Entomortierella parvispora]|uniref:Disintegrin domain-containing protein n=1 Tax=Entomortierella parvispora TaxID=205924 RepID=A0A9P3H9K5_9FUNG|nr:hypothetical protein EMPS_04988 [Entomortierella parvispora]
MSLSSCILLLSTALVLMLVPLAQAHSSAWPTITRSEHILNLRHDILPKAPSTAPLGKRSPEQPLAGDPGLVRMEDTIRLQFSAFNTTFHLHLEPNLDLIHPDADLGHHADGRPVSRHEIKAFKGIVVQDEYHSDRKWDRASKTSKAEKRTVEHMLHEEGVLGWARMMVEHDPEDDNALLLRGAFMVQEDTYHVSTGDTYHIQKRSEDAVPRTTPERQRLVIYRDSDLYRPNHLARRKRGLDQQTREESACGTDLLQGQSEKEASGLGISYSDEDFYHPPNLTSTLHDSSLRMASGFDLSSSWTDVIRHGPLMQKREVALKVAGPNPVPSGCPANRMVNYMGVAADCTYVRSYKGAAEARKQIFADFNTASGIYESTFNVALGVITLNIVPDGCPTTPVQGQAWNQDCSVGYAIDQRLSDFSFWRGQGGRANDGAGLWHLMTKCNSGPVVGIAWTKALCQMKALSQDVKGQIGQTQYTAGTGVSSITPNEWMVVAHEIGHGFGAIHDCNSQTCAANGVATGQCCPLSTTTCDAGANYIMNPSESVATKQFSPCSIKTICATIKSSSGQCLRPPGTRSTQNSQSNICGNGLKEPGEECDCGSAADCAKDPCCDGTTCKLKGGAVCDDLNDDCCLNCKLKPQGQVCRPSISQCDIQEVCSGTSATCPADEHLANQTPCNGTTQGSNGTATSGLECANGVCTSRDLQCQQQDRPGITKQCGASTSCALTCNDPSGAALSCMQIPGVFFLDGTSCGFGGSCNQGECQYSSGVNGVLAWAKNHLWIVVPVVSLFGLMFLCCVWSCCCAGCVDRRRQMQSDPNYYKQDPNGYQFAGYVPSPSQYPPQQYPMGPLSAPPPVYQDGQNPHRRSTGSTNGAGGNPFAHPNDNQHNNPFADHHAQQYQPPSRQHPSPGGYI